MREGWCYKKLGEVATYVNGFAFKPEQWTDEGMPIVRIQNLNNPSAPYNYCTEKLSDQYLIKKGDILISWSASLGAYEWQQDDAYLNQHIFKVVFDKLPIDKYYLKYAVESRLEDMKKQVHGATMQHITKKNFDNILIPYPEVSTQQQIASELDLLSHILDQKRQQLKEYDALAESIFYDMFGDPVENPKGWEKKKLGDICSQIKDGVHAKPQYVDFGVPFVSVININKGVLNLSDCKYVSQEAYAKMSKSFKAEKGDILYSKVGATYGIPALVDTDQEFGLYVSVSLLKPKREIVLPLFLKISMGLRYIKDQADKGIKGIGVPDLHLSVIKEFQVLLPPLTLQRSFASKIQSIEHQKQLLRASIKETEMLFQSRMDYWFNG